MINKLKPTVIILLLVSTSPLVLAGTSDPNVSKIGHISYDKVYKPHQYLTSNYVYESNQCHVSGQVDAKTKQCSLTSVCTATYDCNFSKNSQGYCPDDARLELEHLKPVTTTQKTSCEEWACTTQPAGAEKMDMFARCKSGMDYSALHAIYKIMQTNSSLNKSGSQGASEQINVPVTDTTKIDAVSRAQALQQQAQQEKALEQKCSEPSNRTLVECGGVGSAQ